MQKMTRVDVLKKWSPFIIIIGFVIFKVQDLFLPYFWDEAWSYIVAIKAMVISGPSLIPNSIPPDLYRGHPLLFYFLSASWITLFGPEIWKVKLFMLFISIALLLSVFSFAKRNFNYQTAIISLVFLVIQSVFIVQSTLVLPEIMLALFTVLSLKAYLERKRMLVVFWLILALYTKESAIVIYMTILFFEIVDVWKNKERKLFDIIYLGIPPLFVLLFFVAQRVIVGWFFFPEHIAFLSLDAFFSRFLGYSTNLFVFMGRNMLTFTGFAALVILLIKKDPLLFEKKKERSVLTFFIVAYLLFSAVNFYSPRYLLSILPFVILIWVFFIGTLVKKYHFVIQIVVLLILFSNNLYFTINKRGGDDHTLGYRDLIYVQKEIISYCEQENLYSENLFTHFLMLHNLQNADLGYIRGDSIFVNANSRFSADTEFAIISANEFDPAVYAEIQSRSQLIKRFEKNGAWCELYQVRGE
ncbi:MAG: glycosyltransferase family 39 protein [Salinivirgaceae bacterium]|nr:glycosyltransferase family 39 protein [Salinivirgaceae bacterium]MDY0280408.1 glycosyltransferase family 39 protein [Salinivirgaceae bacterium]